MGPDRHPDYAAELLDLRTKAESLLMTTGVYERLAALLAESLRDTKWHQQISQLINKQLARTESPYNASEIVAAIEAEAFG